MTLEDFEASLKLARFMGWQEAQTEEERLAAGNDGVTTFATFGAPDWIVVYPADRLVPYEWRPLERPEQTAAIMQRGVELAWHFFLQYNREIAHCEIESLGSREVIGSNVGQSWPQTVCLATIQAIDHAELNAEMERALAT